MDGTWAGPTTAEFTATAEVGVTAGRPPATAATAGIGAHAPEAGRSAAARAPAFSVSQPSAGQVPVVTPLTRSEPTEPARARRHSAGVPVADTSVQRRPGIPISTTRGGVDPAPAEP